MLNLDTHILLFAIHGGLNREEERLLADDFWGISDIVLWELGQIDRRGRTPSLSQSPGFHAAMERVTIWPITWEIVRAARRLDFRSDPADEIIAATSLVEDAPLVTRDMRILQSRVVPLALR